MKNVATGDGNKFGSEHVFDNSFLYTYSAALFEWEELFQEKCIWDQLMTDKQ